MSARYAINFNKHGEGFVVNEVAGQNLGLHKLVYRTAAGVWSLADADTVATMPVLGITMGAITTGKKGWILLWGYIGDTLTWAWTAGGEIYASTTAGELTQTMPVGIGDVVQVVAVAVETDIIQFMGTAGAALHGSNTLEGHTAYVGFDGTKNHFVNYFLVDGTADNVQIAAAITYVNGLSGGSIFLEAGTYDIAAASTLQDNIDIYGVGEGTVLVRSATAYIFLASADNCSISYMKIDGGGEDRHCIFAGGGSYDNTRVEYIHFVNNGTTDQSYIYLINTDDGIISNCVFDDGYRGLIMDNQTNTTVTDNAFTGQAFLAIGMATGSIGHIIEGNKIEDCARGIILSGGHDGNHVISDNVIDNTTTSNGINGSQNNLTIIGNVLTACAGASLGVAGDNIVIQGNVVELGEAMGITSEGGSNIVIDGNTSRQNQFSGIYVINTTYAVVSNNICVENSQDGVGNYDGIQLGVVTENCTINGNRCVDDQGTETMRDGIRITNGSYHIVTDNECHGGNGYGVNLTAGAVIGAKVKDNVLYDNTSGQLNDLGTDTEVHELPIYVKDPDGNIGTHPAVVLPDGADTVVYDQVQIPLEFQELVTAEIIIVPAAAGNMRRSAVSNWGKIASGEAYNASNDAIAAGQVAVDADDLEGIDVSTLFTGIAAGDQIGFTFTREATDVLDTINDACYYLGGRIRYV